MSVAGALAVNAFYLSVNLLHQSSSRVSHSFAAGCIFFLPNDRLLYLCVFMWRTYHIAHTAYCTLRNSPIANSKPNKLNIGFG